MSVVLARQVYLGVDPGASGGLVLIHPDYLDAAAMPDTAAGIWRWLRDCSFLGLPVTAAIEKVGGYVGGDGQPGSAMFNFGRNYGQLYMAVLAATGSEPLEVLPRTWQKWFGIDKKGPNETKTHWKNRLKAKAKEIFPHVAVTLYTADALLIAEWLRQTQLKVPHKESPRRRTL